MKAALICVGSELLRGKINTHCSVLAKKLAALNIELGHEETVPDEEALLTKGIRQALEDFPLVIVTGGLGPTFDDISREAAAAATGRRLKRDPRQLAVIEAKFRKAKYQKMPPANARQAQVLEGAEVLPNA